MYNWSVVLSRNDSAEYETLRSENFVSDFKSKRNAQLFAESYALGYIMGVDGINRLEPFSKLLTAQSEMKGLEVSRKYISEVESDKRITELKCHYIVGSQAGNPWGLTVHKTHIFTTPKIVTSMIEKIEEHEVEEEQEVEIEKQIVVPGRFFNGSRTEKTKEKIMRKVKKQICVLRPEIVTFRDRIVDGSDVFTLSLLKTRSADHIDPVERENAITVANALAKNFAETNVAKILFATSNSTSTYKISELKKTNAKEFGTYRPPEKNTRKTPQPVEKPHLDIRRATSTLGLRSNTGASFAVLGEDILKKRAEMFPQSKQ